MSKVFKMMGGLVLAGVLVFGFSSSGFSGYMMEPDNETHAITTETHITVVGGTFTETERYHVEKQLADDNYAVIDYSEDLRTVRSDATLDKTFKSNTRDVPNVAVFKDFTSEAVEPAGYTRDTERVGLIRVQPATAGIGWCPHCAPTMPEDCAAVAAGSSIEGIKVISHTDTEVSVFGDPITQVPTLSHKINAHVEHGTAKAGMAVDRMAGPFNGNPTTTERYEQHTAGTGVLVDLKKSMKYQSHIPRAHLPVLWDRIP